MAKHRPEPLLPPYSSRPPSRSSPAPSPRVTMDMNHASAILINTSFDDDHSSNVHRNGAMSPSPPYSSPESPSPNTLSFPSQSTSPSSASNSYPPHLPSPRFQGDFYNPPPPPSPRWNSARPTTPTPRMSCSSASASASARARAGEDERPTSWDGSLPAPPSPPPRDQFLRSPLRGVEVKGDRDGLGLGMGVGRGRSRSRGRRYPESEDGSFGYGGDGDGDGDDGEGEEDSHSLTSRSSFEFRSGERDTEPRASTSSSSNPVFAIQLSPSGGNRRPSSSSVASSYYTDSRRASSTSASSYSYGKKEKGSLKLNLNFKSSPGTNKDKPIPLSPRYYHDDDDTTPSYPSSPLLPLSSSTVDLGHLLPQPHTISNSSSTSTLKPYHDPSSSQRRRRMNWSLFAFAVLVLGGIFVTLTRGGEGSVVGNGRWTGIGSLTGGWSLPAVLGGAAGGGSTGGDGDTVVMDDGTEFVYENEFGGTFDSSPSGANARAQSYSPSMSERWDFASDKIFGVNLGGWLNVEPFITPYLFEPFENDTHPAIDEWSLSVKLGDRLEPVLRSHYETFVTEKDFAEIAGAGLNWVRIPLPYWAIEVEQDEPFLPNVSWEYFLKAVRWARKYGLRINLDLHTAPGSQNGWNHSGKFGNVGFMNGPMGLVNAQRTLNHIRALSEFLKTPENSQVVMMFGIMNEPLAAFMGDESLMTFYYEAYKTIRSITGLGEGHGPMISIHDSFERTRNWLQFLHGADRLSLDNHRYIAFRDPNTDPISELALMPCEKWGYQTNQTLAEFGFVSAGEFSVAVNDCGRYLNGVGMGFRFDGTFPTKEDPTMPGAGTCRDWDDYRMWDKKKRRDLLAVALNHMDSTRNWFYWTWKTSDSLVTKLTVNPLWSYSLGRREGWIPRDPRNALGSCESYTAAMGAEAPRLVEWDGTLQPWQTGGEGAGDIDIEQDDKYGTFPPLKLKNKMVVADLPRYTPTGIPKVLKGVDPKSVQKGGWYVPVKGCEYLGSWTDLDTPLPTKTCPL